MIKKSGRPRKTSSHEDNMIQQIAVESPTSFCKKICMLLLLKSSDVHHTTTSRHLVYDFNLKAFKPAKKPCITPALKTKRLAFAKQYEE